MKNGNKYNSFWGTASEYFVAGELSRRKWHAALTIKNAEGIDILCSNGNKTVEIQVKGSYGTKNEKNGWRLREKNESWIGKNKFYCFVNLNNLENPDIYIFPSEIVAKNIKEGHKLWLKTPGKRVLQHKDQKMRAFPSFNNFGKINLEDYKNNFDLLWKNS